MAEDKPTLDQLAHRAAQAGHDALVAESKVRLWTERLEAASARRLQASNAYYLALQAAEAKPEPEPVSVLGETTYTAEE